VPDLLPPFCLSGERVAPLRAALAPSTWARSVLRKPPDFAAGLAASADHLPLLAVDWTLPEAAAGSGWLRRIMYC
jgi:hypothetical protein